MRPILFNIGELGISSYFTFITLGIFLGLFFFYKYSKKNNLNSVVFADISIITILSAYVGGRLFHILFVAHNYYIENPIEIFYFWKGGYVIYGAILTPLLTLYIYSKIKKLSFAKITDALSPSFAIGTALGRFACFMQGCCYGKETNSFIGLVFPEGANSGITPSGVPLHPTQLYFSLQGILIFFILKYRFKNKKFNGEITLWFLILYSITRIIIEYFRADFRGYLFEPYLSTSQFISVIVIIISTYVLARAYVKNR